MSRKRPALILLTLTCARAAAFADDQALSIPPLAQNLSRDPQQAEFNLTAQIGESTFIAGRHTTTLGYNGVYLGPTLRIRSGQHVKIHVRNDLNTLLTTHWHGLILPGDADGGPLQPIQPGATWTAEFDAQQPAGTFWYHPHPDGRTAPLVYLGLAGLLVIDDDTLAAQHLPHEYGVNDFPLILQDRDLLGGQLLYRPDMMDVMTGLSGDTLLVNGTITPHLDVPASLVRFRILNGSNARIHHLRRSDHAPLTQIASDGGLLSTPAQVKQLDLAPGERAEIVVDFSRMNAGQVLQIVSDLFAVLKCRVKEQPPLRSTLPEQLAKVDRLKEQRTMVHRSFALQTLGMNLAINGRQMDMHRIDAVVRLHETEVWTITSQAGGMMGGGMMRGMNDIWHTFHVHGVQFQVLDRDGHAPAAGEMGWKDTIVLAPGETVRIIIPFTQPGVFMYHCHVLEHEDAGMMGQFEVR